MGEKQAKQACPGCGQAWVDPGQRCGLCGKKMPRAPVRPVGVTKQAK